VTNGESPVELDFDLQFVVNNPTVTLTVRNFSMGTQIDEVYFSSTAAVPPAMTLLGPAGWTLETPPPDNSCADRGLTDRVHAGAERLPLLPVQGREQRAGVSCLPEREEHGPRRRQQLLCAGRTRCPLTDLRSGV
jgi:hypothetical protein